MKPQANPTARRITLSASAFLVGIALLLLVVAVQARPQASAAAVPPAEPDQPQAAVLNGSYLGAADLKWALVGTYTDPLPTPTPQPPATPSPQMGSINLGLLLQQNGSQVSGYVDLGASMVYTTEHTIPATPTGPTPGPGTATPGATPLAVGPSVTGTYDGAHLTLESERFAMTTQSGVPLQRQFRFTGAPDPDNNHRFTGEYRETIWGLGSKPLTLIGTFSLVQPVAPTPLPSPTPTTVSTATPTPAGTATPTATPGQAGANKSYLPLLQR